MVGLTFCMTTKICKTDLSKSGLQMLPPLRRYETLQMMQTLGTEQS